MNGIPYDQKDKTTGVKTGKRRVSIRLDKGNGEEVRFDISMKQYEKSQLGKKGIAPDSLAPD